MASHPEHVHASPAPAPQPRRRADTLRRRIKRLFGPFWVIPALSCVAALILGLLAPQVDQRLSEYVPFLFPAGTDGARTMLSTIAGAMISLTGLVFSITIVVLQLASSQFSPRVLSTFLDEGVPQVTLGVFAASFIYALTVLRSVSGTVDGQQTEVPQIALTVAFLLVLASVGMFLAFIHHITESISVEVIVQAVGKDTRQSLKGSRAEAKPEAQGESSKGRNQSTQQHSPTGTGEDAAEGRGTRTVVVLAASNGYLNYVDAPALVEAASSHAVCIKVLHPLGTFLVADQPLATLHPLTAGRDEQSLQRCEDKVQSAASVTSRRSMEQDVSFGLRQLVDIAERALSPGVNDPTTAVQVLNELHTILRLIAAQPNIPPTHSDPDGVVRLVTCEWTFEQYLDLCIDEIAHWGVSSLQVPRRIDQLLTQLQVTAHAEHRESIAAKAARVRVMTAAQR